MLHFDGDLRRIYEVPTGSTYTIDASGYRVYTGGTFAPVTTVALWSHWVDWHDQNKWSTLALEKSGGAFRYTLDGKDIYATFDLRLINGWQLVPANFAHQWLIVGNLFDDADLGSTFDTDRITEPGVIPSVQFADSMQTVAINSGSGLTAEQAAMLLELYRIAGLDRGNPVTIPPGAGTIQSTDIDIAVDGDCDTGHTLTRQ